VRAAAVPAARRPFGSALLLVGLLTATTGAVAILVPRPAYLAPRPATVAERLARGESVELIGPTGEPLVAPAEVPGAAGQFSTVRDGFCTFSCVRLAAADLAGADLPLPVRFESDVALSRWSGPQSWAAVYVGRKEYPGAAGVRHSQAQVALARTGTAPRPGGEAEVTEAVRAEALWWAPATGSDREELGRVDLTRHEPAAFPAPLAWHRVAVTLAGDRAAVEVNGRPVAAVRAEELVRLGDGFGRSGWLPGGPAGAPPAFGPGFGVSVNNAEAVFRNARLVPLTANHP
jgi:hypothetical protein